MKKVAGLTAICTFIFLGKIDAQNVVVSGASVGNGSYADVGAAFTAINSGAQTGTNIVVSIVGNTTEGATATLNQGTWTSLTISPAGGAARTISGNIAGALVSFSGADRVVVNGLNTGGNSLTIDNSSTGTASTIQFINDAHLVTIQNCTVRGSNTATTSGTIFLSTATATGNDTIGLVGNDILESGANLPVNSILSIGTATAGMENSSVTVSNCNVANFFSATTVSYGITAQTGNTDWTVTGNRFYQSALRTYTTANTHAAIQITSGNNHQVTSNTIGYASSAGTGTYTMNSTVATRFIGIQLSVGTTTASSVQGNTVTAIALGTSSGAATQNGILCGISVTGGSVNIGTVSGNIIGGSSGTNLLAAVPTTTQGMVVGINSQSTGTMVISNNTIGGLSSSGATAAVAGGVAGINVTAVAASMTITNNTIGNTTADNMRSGTSGLTTGSSLASGINLPSTPTISVITGNTIQNFSSYGTGTGGYVRGIWTAAATGSGASYTISSNTIHDLTTTSGLTTITSGQAVAVGINLSTGTNGVASNNTIYNISYSGTAATQNFVVGITLGNATTSTAANNLIYGLSNGSTGTTATSPPLCAGILVRSGTTNVTIYNNMISLGNSQTSNTVFVGIELNHGSTPDPIDRIWNNTINLEGTVTAGALSTFGIHRGDFTATTRAQTVDIKNNIVTNNRTGGTGQHFAIGNGFNNAASTATGWASGASDYNVLNAANASTVGYWTGAVTMANWRTASASDALSFSGITVTYVNTANNLHLNMGVTPTLIESGGTTIVTYTTDIDGQTRPGPTGSVNGGAYAYDIGADEFDGTPIDGLAPVITYSPLSFTCSTSDRTFTATITDLSGVPTSGILQPRVYFRKNAGPWFSTQGVLTTGTATNGTWTFSILSATMGGLSFGDVVDYYVIAQDIVSPTPNIASNPSAGLVAADVNTVTTAPTTPNSYPVSGALSGTYTVGATGTYTTLTAAVNAYNTSCLSGAVTFLLIDANYSTSETFPIVINANPNASAVNTLTIKPQNAGTTITGSAACIIKFNGADFVTIDGTISSTVNSACPPVASASRDLTINNTSTAALSSVIWISSTGAGAGATNNTIVNCNIAAGVDQSATATETYDIVSCGATVTAFPPSDGLDNNSNRIENNFITKATWGIYLRGGASSSNNGNIVRQNVVGPSAFGSNEIRKGGIIIQHQNAATVYANEVQFVGNQFAQAVGGTDHIGIGVGGADGPTPTTTNVTNSIVSYNYVHDIVCEKTFSAVGIQISANNAAASNNEVTNNMVNNVRTNGTSPDQGIGINITNGNNDIIVYNTVNMVTADRDPAGSTTATQSDMCYRFQAGALNPTFENNIGYIDAGSNTGTLMNFVCVAPSAAYTWTVSNYNDYSINTAGTQNVLFGLGTIGTIPPVSTLAAWQGTFTPPQDANSITVVPVFVSATDLHLLAGSNNSLQNLGTPIPAFTSDFDCETRSATAPDMGADEFCSIATTPTISATATTICDGSSSTLSISTGTLNESTDWQWYSASCGGTPEGNGTSIVVTPAVTTDYYVRGEGGCASNGACANITITVNPVPTVTAAPLVNVVCAGDSVTLFGSGALTYVWSGPESVTDNVAFAPTVSGTYTVTGTDGNGCADTDSSTVTVNALPTVVANIASQTVCAGTSVTLFGSGAVSYVWMGPEVISDNTPFNASLSGTYTVTGTDANGCINTDTSAIVVNALPVVTYSEPTDTVCQTTTPVFALSGETPSGGTWSGTAVSGNMFDPMSASIGYNVVTYMYTDSVTGCSASAMDSIYVDLCLSVSGNTNSSSVEVYPNPNAGMFTLHVAGHCDQLVVEVMSIDGKVVFAQQQNDVDAYNAQIDLSGFADGTYFVRVKQDEQTAVVKVVKAE